MYKIIPSVLLLAPDIPIIFFFFLHLLPNYMRTSNDMDVSLSFACKNSNINQASKQ